MKSIMISPIFLTIPNLPSHRNRLNRIIPYDVLIFAPTRSSSRLFPPLHEDLCNRNTQLRTSVPIHLFCQAELRPPVDQRNPKPHCSPVVSSATPLPRMVFNPSIQSLLRRLVRAIATTRDKPSRTGNPGGLTAECRKTVRSPRGVN